MHKERKNNMKRQPLKLCTSQLGLQPGVCLFSHRLKPKHCSASYVVYSICYMLMFVFVNFLNQDLTDIFDEANSYDFRHCRNL